MKRNISLLLILLLCIPSSLLGQSRGTPSQLRVKVDANGYLVVVGGAQTNPLTTQTFINQRLATDANGYLQVILAGGSAGFSPSTCAAPSIYETGATTTGIAFALTPSISNCISGTAVTTLTSTGLGIGTTNPGSKLEVNANGSLNAGHIVVKGTTANSLLKMQVLDTSSGAGFIGNENSFPLWLGTSNIARMAIDTAGNVGIGTIAPNSNLDIYATINPEIRMTSLSDGYLQLGQFTNGAYIGPSSSDSVDGVLRLGVGGSEKVRIDSSGNVGIGTTNPGAKLDVTGTYTDVTTAQLIVDGGASGAVIGLHTADTLRGILRADNTGGVALESTGSGGINFNYTGGSGDTKFWNGSGSELLTIKQNGYVGIGTSTPTTNTLQLVDSGTFGWSDISLSRLAADTVGLRRGTNTQTLQIGPAGAYLKLEKTNGAAGSIGTFDNQPLYIVTNDIVQWYFNGAGHFIANGAVNIGDGAGNSPDLVYAETKFVAPLFQANAGTKLSASVDGKWLITDSAGTDFSLLQFGGTTNSFPALKRSGADLLVVKADDSAYSNIYASNLFSTSGAFLARTTSSWTDGASAQTGTLTNAPSAGNPTKWIAIDDNGTTRYIPAW